MTYMGGMGVVVGGSPRERRYICMLLLLSCFSRVQLCATPWTAAHQAPLSKEFFRQEYWNRLPFSSPVYMCTYSWGFPGVSLGKESACSAGDSSSMGGLRRSPAGGHGSPLQYSCLENSWTEEPGGLPSIRLQRVGQDWSDLAHTHIHNSWFTLLWSGGSHSTTL